MVRAAVEEAAPAVGRVEREPFAVLEFFAAVQAGLSIVDEGLAERLPVAQRWIPAHGLTRVLATVFTTCALAFTLSSFGLLIRHQQAHVGAFNMREPSTLCVGRAVVQAVPDVRVPEIREDCSLTAEVDIALER